MEHDLVLEGRVVTPDGIQELEVGIDGGLIAKLGHGLRGSRKIAAGRSLIFPGFIDMHVHMREPGWEHKEDFLTGTRAAAHGGVTTVADMPNNPVPTTTAAALGVKEKLAEKALVDVRLYGGLTPQSLEEVSALAGKAVGYKVYLSETTGVLGLPGPYLKRAFGAIALTHLPVCIHCEDQPTIDRRREELAGVEGADVHCDLRPPEAEAEAVRNVVTALRQTPGLRGNVCHASTGLTVSLVKGAREEGLDLRCEAALHHLYFERSSMLENRMLKTNPPLRSDEDRQALLQGLREGGVSFLVTDHAPHTEEEKMEGAAGVPGLDDYAHIVSWLIRDQGFDPTRIADITSRNPARFLRLKDRGEIAAGKRADFTVLDIHSPERVRSEDVRSRCGWSPYEGKVFPGRARWAISKGETVLDDYELITERPGFPRLPGSDWSRPRRFSASCRCRRL